MTLPHTSYDRGGDFGAFYEGNQRVKGIEPSCAAWEAAVLPLNYTRNGIFDFRFPIYDLQAANITARKSRHRTGRQ
jgi:hypothetical protein